MKLRKLIKIPSERKDKIFTEMMKGFVRYKEPLRIKQTIINICKTKGFITSSMLKKEMNYKTVNCAIKWIKGYSKKGLLELNETSYYGGNRIRNPAKYVLINQKSFK